MKIDYEPDGAVLYNFLMSRARVNVIQGPWGSGKSHCCCIKLILNAAPGTGWGSETADLRGSEYL